MRKIVSILAALMLVALVLVLSACSSQNKEAVQGQQALRHEQQNSNGALSRVTKTEPVPILYDSSDAHNQRLFYTVQSDPNKIEYLTLISLSGQPYAHFTIKGQVSAMSTQETNAQQLACSKWTTEHTGKEREHEENTCGVIGQADPNGVYPGPDNAHFAFTTNGALIEWEGPFVQSDQPFEIKTPVALTLNENVAPTATSLAHVQGGELPNGRSK